MFYQRQRSIYNNKQGVSVINTILMVLIVFVVTAASFFYISAVKNNSFSSDFQVVVLDTGEVFFGTIRKNTSDSVELINAYYLPIDATDLFSPKVNGNDTFSVIKIGNEFHGPEDSMFITKEHIVFIQNLKDDSRVVAAIKEYQQ